MTAYEILRSLPTSGHPAVTFSSDANATFTEGLVVRFTHEDGTSWCGNFIRGYATLDAVLPHPDGRHVVVVSAGQAFILEPDSGSLLSVFGGGLHQFLAAPPYLLFHDSMRLSVLSPGAELWETSRLSWDGLKDLAVSRGIVTGRGWVYTEEWLPFSVNLVTREVHTKAYWGPTGEGTGHA